MQEMRIDRFDLALLQALQQDSHLTNAELGTRISLSPSQVCRRIQRLEELGVIKGYTALLDGEVLGLGVMAYAQIILERHDKARGSEFESAVAKLAAVVECFAVTGEADYMLRIVAPDLPGHGHQPEWDVPATCTRRPRPRRWPWPRRWVPLARSM